MNKENKRTYTYEDIEDKFYGVTKRRYQTYVDKGLIKPVHGRNGPGNKLEFTEEEYAKLPLLGVLSKAGFSYDKIGDLLNPESSGLLAETTVDTLEEQLRKLRDDEVRIRQSIVRLQALQLFNMAVRPTDYFEKGMFSLADYLQDDDDAVDIQNVRIIGNILTDQRFKKALFILFQMKEEGISQAGPTVSMTTDVIWNVCQEQTVKIDFAIELVNRFYAMSLSEFS